ncbi:MAG: hypothetical protein U0794_15300 [Isosphaeraceae bacterium]
MLACLCLAFALTAITPADEPGPSFPGKTWEARTPEAVGLDPAALDGLRSAFGGRGCVIRHGRLGFQWGNIAQRADVASAVKPVFAHFLLRALQEKRIDSLDTPVVRFEPRLADLNPELGHKDRSITFRQMIFQTSCYGVSEAPGTAFDYNDWQMALLADTLFLKVYASTYERLDQEVVGSRLFDAIGCEDQPGFRAPGGRGSVGRLAISVRDFARFGWLYRNEGRWNGKEILRPDLAQDGRHQPAARCVSSNRGTPGRPDRRPADVGLDPGSRQSDRPLRKLQLRLVDQRRRPGGTAPLARCAARYLRRSGARRASGRGRDSLTRPRGELERRDHHHARRPGRGPAPSCEGRRDSLIAEPDDRVRLFNP